MAVYIDDTGAYGFDAQLIGVEDTAWSRNTTDNCVWFSSTGTCETGLTLPNSEWIVYEVYENDAQANDLTGGTNVYAWIEYTTTIGTIATTLSTWYTAWDSEATTRGYTTYSVKATHYKGSDLADVYDADETGTFGAATTTNGGYTGYGSEWVINDTLLADTVINEVNSITEYTVVNNLLGGATLVIDTTVLYALDLQVTAIGTSTQYPRIGMNYTTALDGSSTYRYSFDYTLDASVCKFVHFVNGGYGSYITLTEGSHTWTRDVVSSSADSVFQLRFDGKELFDLSITNAKVIKL